MRRRSMLAYGIAVAVAAALIGGGWLFVRQSEGELREAFAQLVAGLKAQKAAGTLPAEWQNVDLDNLDPSRVGLRVPAALQTRIEFADFLSAWWLVLAPLAVGICLGLAAVADRWWLSAR